MVFHAISRACISCKKRRKKCDLTRPSCLRCLRANRTCAGYEDAAFSAFREYRTQDCNQQAPFVSTARKCTLPRRSTVLSTGILPEDLNPPEIPEATRNEFALRAFFYDFCVTTTNPALSSGFLSGLESRALRLGPKSDLVKACQSLALFCHGKPMNRHRLIRRAERLHQDLLGSLARAIQSPVSGNSVELKYVVILLGLYEIAATDITNRGNHQVHAKGLTALFYNSISPQTLPGAFKPSHFSRIFSTPALSDHNQSLKSLIYDLDDLWTRYEQLSVSEDCRRIRDQCIALNERFAQWANSRVSPFKPTVVATPGPYGPESPISVCHWPGRVDSYFDLFVAGVWNIIRAARLLLITLIVRLSGALDEEKFSANFIDTGRVLVEDMLASIPYHLTDNLHSFLKERATCTEVKDPGRMLGGFLLIHPIYVASKIPFVPKQIQDYFRRCLLWIGLNMGIGQATLLAKANDIDREYLETGCMIIWAGFLG